MKSSIQLLDECGIIFGDGLDAKIKLVPSVHHIRCSHPVLIHDITTTAEKFMPQIHAAESYDRMINRYIRYVGTLPVSNSDDRNGAGLLAKSLELAKRKMKYIEKLQSGQVLQTNIKKDELMLEAFMSGLLHYTVDVLCNVRIHDVNSGLIWNPNCEDLYAWWDKHNVRHHSIKWAARGTVAQRKRLTEILRKNILNGVKL